MTMTDTAYACMSKRKKEMEFNRLWADVAKTMKIPEDQLARKKASFYSQLMLDPRFAALSGNKWDLRDRHSFEEVHGGQAEAEDDDDVDEDAEEEEEAELPAEDEY